MEIWSYNIQRICYTENTRSTMRPHDIFMSTCQFTTNSHMHRMSSLLSHANLQTKTTPFPPPLTHELSLSVLIFLTSNLNQNHIATRPRSPKQRGKLLSLSLSRDTNIWPASWGSLSLFLFVMTDLWASPRKPHRGSVPVRRSFRAVAPGFVPVLPVVVQVAQVWESVPRPPVYP